MAFLISCPNCGERDVHEFRFGGEVTARPTPDSSDREWIDYFYLRHNRSGLQREWWYHGLGCRKWFQAERDTVTNIVERSFWPPPPESSTPRPSDEHL